MNPETRILFRCVLLEEDKSYKELGTFQDSPWIGSPLPRGLRHEPRKSSLLDLPSSTQGSASGLPGLAASQFRTRIRKARLKKVIMYLAQPQRPHPVPNPPPPLSMDRITASAASYPASTSAGGMTPASARSEGPKSTETTYGGWTWRLDVVQQPIRARMCGFGDKVRSSKRISNAIRTNIPWQDRRPITPPPCVRLIVTDAKSGKEIDVR